jgi:hypothetical protein
MQRRSACDNNSRFLLLSSSPVAAQGCCQLRYGDSIGSWAAALLLTMSCAVVWPELLRYGQNVMQEKRQTTHRVVATHACRFTHFCPRSGGTADRYGNKVEVLLA